MATPSLRLLTLGELAGNKEEVLGALLRENETLFVEQKSGMVKGDGYQVAKAAGSFANTLGGWILVGVKDGKLIPDWKPPKGGFVDAIRQRMEGQIDPLPSFAADVLPYGSGQIGVIRVYESTDTPHILLADGSVVVREPAQDTRLRKAGQYEATPIRSHYELAQLARRGEATETAAERRLGPRALPLIEESLQYGWSRGPDGPVFEPVGEQPAFLVRVAPLNLGTRWREWAVTRDAVATASAVSTRILGGEIETDEPRPHPSGVAVTGRDASAEAWTPGGHRFATRVVTCAIDAGGALGVRLGFNLQAGSGRVNDWRELDAAELEGIALPVLDAATSALADSEHLGRYLVHVLWLGFGQLFRVDPMDEGQGGPPSYLPGGGSLTIDGLSDRNEQKALVGRRVEELLRASGLPVWSAG